ncbi:MAG: hypothetical protein V2B20_02975 [Pseudomonadota bacterium]
MNENPLEILSPKECANRIHELSGVTFEPVIAVDLWTKILKHKWLLSEKLDRDVGLRTACIDFLENLEQVPDEIEDTTPPRANFLKEMGDQTLSRDLWDTISDSQPPKQLVQRRIIQPLTEEGLSLKHGVVPPKAIVFLDLQVQGKPILSRPSPASYHGDT